MTKYLNNKPKICFAIIRALLVLVSLLLLLWGPALYRTAYIISHVVPGVPKWFEFGKYDIRFDEFEFKRQIEPGDPNKIEYTTQIVDIYRPEGPRKSSFVILFPGFTDEGSKDPRLVNFAKALTGAGIGVAIPQSFTIRNGVFTMNDIDHIRDTFTFLQSESYVEPQRIGIIGFSVGGSYVLRAASSLGNRPLFILSLGAYYSLSDLISSIVAEKAVYDGRERYWKPNSFPKELLRDYLDKQIGIAKADEIFSNNGINFEEFGRNNQKFKERLRELSPSPILSQIETTVFLMHDRNDGNTPVEDARKIRDALPENIPVYYAELSIMNHVTPNTYLSFDFAKLFWHVLNTVRLLI
jgi:acetyl esterase/lipase